MGEQREEGLIGLPHIGLTQVHPVATQGLHIHLLQLARSNQEGQVVDQTQIIGTRQRVLAGALQSQSSRIEPLHSGCVAHGAVEGRNHLLLIPDQAGTNDMEHGRLGSHTPGQEEHQEKNHSACFRFHPILLSASPLWKGRFQSLSGETLEAFSLFLVGTEAEWGLSTLVEISW